NLHKGTVELNTLGAVQEIGHISRVILCKPRGCFLAGLVRCTVEEKRYGRIENRRDRLQPAGADSVGSFFVFLDLLKGDAQAFAQLFLAYAQHVTAEPDSTPHVNINRVWPLLVVGHVSL